MDKMFGLLVLDNNVSGDYSDKNFWDVVKKYAKCIGYELVYKVLQLYYVLQKDSLSAKYKIVILCALAYFILPADLIPDCIPIYGWTDDAAVIINALCEVADAIDDDVNTNAKIICDGIFNKS